MSLCLSCTEIHSWVLCCQSRQFQIHHAFWIVSSNFYSSLKSFGIVMSISSSPETAHPNQCFPRLLSDPVHVVASKSKSCSSTGKTQSFSRLYHWLRRNGLHILTIHSYWKIQIEVRTQSLLCNLRWYKGSHFDTHLQRPVKAEGKAGCWTCLSRWSDLLIWDAVENDWLYISISIVGWWRQKDKWLFQTKDYICWIVWFVQLLHVCS